MRKPVLLAAVTGAVLLLKRSRTHKRESSVWTEATERAAAPDLR